MHSFVKAWNKNNESFDDILHLERPGNFGPGNLTHQNIESTKSEALMSWWKKEVFCKLILG